MSAPTAMSGVLCRLGAVSALTAAAVAGPAVLPDLAQQAEAATVSAKALKIAASKRGALYQYGAAGPGRFDCSGLTFYSFKKAGKKLPRTAGAQYNSVRHIRKSARTRGDLVFFHYGSNVYHVGMYAGHGKIWHSPKPGGRVRLEKIWSRSVWYGRVK